jgi:hypothetical protein
LCAIARSLSRERHVNSFEALADYEEQDVLKITEMPSEGLVRLFKLEGKLVGPWVDELRNVCVTPLQRSESVRLDLAAVTFVDAAGADLVRDLIRQGIAIAHCSDFVAELLHAEDT